MTLVERMRLGLAEGVARVWRRAPPHLRWWALHRSNDRFLLGVLGLVADPSDRVLLLEHRFRVPWRWGLPGGFVRHGESLDDALRRELREELGLELLVDAAPFDVELTVRSRNLSTTFAARPAGELAALRPVDRAEITGAGFFGPQDLPEGLYPRHERLVRAFWRSRGLG